MRRNGSIGGACRKEDYASATDTSSQTSQLLITGRLREQASHVLL